jgi:hypothetical protein
MYSKVSPAVKRNGISVVSPIRIFKQPQLMSDLPNRPKFMQADDEVDDEEVTDKEKWAERLKNAVCQGHELDKAITQIKKHQFNSLTLQRFALICEEDRVHTHKSVTQYLALSPKKSGNWRERWEEHAGIYEDPRSAGWPPGPGRGSRLGARGTCPPSSRI